MAEVEQRPSTMEDYYNVVNPIGIQYNNPGTRFNIEQDFTGSLDTEDPVFKDLYNKSDIETKKELLEATSVSHATKIYDRRKVFEESAQAVNQDPLLIQFSMGVIPALTDPTTAVPVAGAASKALSTAKAVTRLQRAGRVGVAGAVAGGVTNVLSEAVFDNQGIQADYLSAGMFGVAFGGTLGALVGGLSGPRASKISDGMTSKQDTYTTDFDNDPQLIIEKEDGIPKIVGTKDVAQMDKNWLDKIPLLNKWLRSDVNTVYQSESKALREEMTRLSAPTVSVKDADGNIIPIKETGVDFKRRMKGTHNTLTLGIDESYHAARNEGYTGSRQEFVNEVSEEYVRASREQEFNAYKSEMSNEKYYEQSTVEFKSNNPSVNKAAEHYKTYYNKMLEVGKEVGVKELGGVSTGKLYRPRIYDFKRIHKSDISQEDIHSRVYEALKAHPNQAKLDDNQINLAAQELTQNLMNGSFDLNFLSSSYIVPKDIPFGNMLKQRKWKLDESKLGDLLKTNLDDVTGAYHYKMSGRQSVAYAYGTDQLEDITQALRDRMVEEGNVHLKDDINAFERTIRDLLGELRINNLSDTPEWTWTRNLTTFNSVRLGGGFGGNQFIELVSNIFMNGFTNMIQGRFARSWKNTGKLLYTKQDVDDQFTNALINSGFMEEALHTSRINRYADTEAGFNSGVLENSLNTMGDKLMKWNGMRYFMGVMEDMTGGAIMEQVKTLGAKGKLSNIETQRLARWGLTQEDAKSLASDIEKYYDPKEGRLELDKFSKENQDNFQLAISRGIEESVIQGDSIHLPNWMKAPGPILKLMTQFMRFPMIANEVLLRRGMKEEQARMASAVLGSAFAYMGIKYAREQAAIHAGLIEEVDAKYDYFGFNSEEAINKGLLESFNYNAPLGMMTTLFNAGAVATGSPELGRDYSTNNQAEAFFGPTFGGIVPDMLKITKQIADGELADETTITKAKGLTPFNNLPLVNEGLKYIIEEEF